MHDPVSMHTPHSRDDLVENIASFFLRKIMLIYNDIKKFLAFTEFCNYVDVLALFKYFINLEYVWMVLSNRNLTNPLSREISFRIIAFAFPNLRVFIFFIALVFFVC